MDDSSNDSFPLSTSEGRRISTLVCKYQVQILLGCGERSCRKPFCKSRQATVFAGKSICNSAVMPLCLNLVATSAESGLCDAIAMMDFDESSVRLLVDINDPYSSPLLLKNAVTDIEANTSEQKRQMSLTHLISDARTILARFLRITSKLSETIQACGNLAVSPIIASKVSHSHLKRSRISVRSLIYYRNILRQSNDVKARWLTFWGFFVTGGQRWSAPRNSFPWILYRPNNDFLHWPTDFSVSISQDVKKITSETKNISQKSNLKICYEYPDFSNTLFRDYKSVGKDAVNITKLSNGLKWGRTMVRLGLLKTLYAVVPRAFYIKSAERFRYTLQKAYPQFLDHPDSVWNASINSGPTKVELMVSRSNLLLSALSELAKQLIIEDKILCPLQIKFEGEELTEDQGGAQQEFFSLIGGELTKGENPLFICDDETQLMWFNEGYVGSDTIYEYVGILIGMGFYNQCIIGVQFPRGFYRILQRPPTAIWSQKEARKLLGVLSPATKRNINLLRRIDDLSLFSFEYNYKDSSGKLHTTKLPSYEKFDGKVTKDNLSTYEDDLIWHTVFGSVDSKIRSFVRGFQFLINRSLIEQVNTTTFQEMVEGQGGLTKDDIDEAIKLGSLKISCSNQNSKTREYLIDTLRELSNSQLTQFCRFVTGSHRVPAGGLKMVSIQILIVDKDASYYPTSSTCSGQLYMPEYDSKEQTREMLLKAFEYAIGFGLA